MREWINNLNKKIQPYYLLITMIVFFMGGAFGVYKFLFAPSDVTVKVVNENINYPSSINEDYVAIYTYLSDSIKDENLERKAVAVYEYLIKTKQQKILHIKNNTNKTIRSINIRENGVRNLISWAVSSEHLLDDEKNKLLKNITFEKSSGIVHLKDAVDLPPNGDLKFYLWGEFNPYSWNESLVVTYDGGTADIEYNKTFSGFQAVIAEFYFPIFLFLLLTFIIVYLLLINKYVDNKENNS